MKTIVNLVSEQTLPNYLFVKEMYEQGDNILWIVSQSMLEAFDCLITALPNVPYIKMELEKNKEEDYTYIQQILEKNINCNEEFCINLTGGTKFMILAVYNFFKDKCKQSNFFYKHLSKNTIININTQETKEIHWRITVKEYLTLCNIKIKEDEIFAPYLSFEDAKYMYSLLESNIYDSEEINTLRNGCYKGKKTYRNDLKQPINIDVLEDEKIKQFIIKNNLPTKEKGKLDKYDVKYLTGEWLEDLIYYITKENEKPDDILKGIHIYKGEDELSDQELDVVYTKDNNFFIRECKTGFEKEKMFNEIVYKAAAIKTLFSISMKSAIYCCREKLDENERTTKKMNETLNKMGVTYFGKKEIENEIDKFE
ncbi:MAG: DUF1887 family protein [Bacteroidales bacterium]|nr:DUF1887 family protein [Bacteroidales bacterium]